MASAINLDVDDSDDGAKEVHAKRKSAQQTAAQKSDKELFTQFFTDVNKRKMRRRGEPALFTQDGAGYA